MITDASTKADLVATSDHQPQPRDCSHLAVCAVRRDLDMAHVEGQIARTAASRGVNPPALASCRQVVEEKLRTLRAAGTLDQWATHQVYVALGFFLATAATLGVDACPMQGIDPAGYDIRLGLAGSDFSTVVVCAAGYRASDDRQATLPKVRFPEDEVFQRV